uniref:Zinc finger BED domain-containing protein 4 n=1 Tax=Sipha flava TaxID=143950 RepID=A0A2S2Q420_9HEMI
MFELVVYNRKELDENAAIQPFTNSNNHNKNAEEEIEDEEEDLLRPINISNVLENGVGDLFNMTLPQHQRCAAHTLNLIATTDIQDAEKDNVYKILSRRVFGKCQALFNKQNQSSQCADQIKNVIGKYLITPNATRWNSYYDAIKCIVDNFNKIDEVFSITSLSSLSRLRETTFLIGYCKVMQPITKGLDIGITRRQSCVSWVFTSNIDCH